MDYVEIGNRIRLVRKELKMTQEELAERGGLSHSFMGHIERGSRKLSVETLYRIAGALNVSTDYLLGLRGKEASAIKNGLKTREDVVQLLEKHWME